MRYSVSRNSGSLSFVIPSYRDRFLVWFVPLWLALLVAIVFGGPPKNSGSYFVIPVFGVAAALVCHQWLWNLWGREELHFDANAFTYRRVLFGISRGRVFAMNEICALRFIASKGIGRRRTPSGLGFLYRGKQIKVGDQLTQGEAKGIALSIIGEFPQYSEIWGTYDERSPDSDKPVQLNLRQT